MKLYFFILLLVFTISIVEAQKPYINKWDSINQNVLFYPQKHNSLYTTKQALDSVKSYNTSPTYSNLDRMANTYDSYGNTVSEVRSYINSTTSCWEELNRREHKFSYSSDGSIELDTLLLSYLTQNIVIRNSVVSTYLNNQITTSIYSSWDTLSSQWIADSKCIKTYNTLGLLICDNWFSWNVSSNSWEMSGKKEYAYDVNKNLILQLDSKWKNAWVPYNRSQYYFNAMNQDTTFSRSILDTLSSQWVTNYLQQSQYDANANLVSVLIKIESAIPGQLRNVQKSIYTYNLMNQMLTRINQNWLADSNKWQSVYKQEFAYDSYSNQTQVVKYLTHTNPFSWNKIYKTVRVYDNSYSYSDLLMPDNYNYDSLRFSHKLLYRTDFHWDKFYQSWNSEFEKTYSYSPKVLMGLKDNKQVLLSMYPNPASDYIHFDLPKNLRGASLYIYDIQGKELLCEDISSSNKISIQSFSSGLYIYKIYSEDFIQSGKFVVY